MMVICWTHGSYLRRRERGAITPQKIQSAIKCLILLSAEELDYQLFIIKKKRGKCEKQLISSADEPHHTQVLKQNGQLCVCVCVCVCVPPFVSGHHSERIRVGQLCQRQSGGSRAVSNRAVTLIANHTHECTHFLEGASQHILRNLGSVYTQTLSSITAVFTLSHRCKHVHTHTHTHTHTHRDTTTETTSKPIDLPNSGRT